MGKYNYQLDMSDRNVSHTMILREISSNSRVLEFGPADGVMTRYMKKTLNCDVFIIEIDEQSYGNALQYAYDGYCGDVEEFEWQNKLTTETRFDFIIFADIIEHLVNPEQVIKSALKYLNFEGKVFISVPNIAHNAVIVDLMKNKFVYRTTGLLDSTHLRHFTYDNLCELVGKCGLFPCVQDGTRVQLADLINEFGNTYNDVSPAVEMALANKDYGTIYQFVFTCIRYEYYKINSDNIVINRKIRDLKHVQQLKLYIEVNGQFTEHNVVETQYMFGYNKLNFDLNDFDTKRVRIDFAERPCVVIMETIKIDGNVIDTTSLEGNYNSKIGNAMLFLHSDPYVFVSADKEIVQLEIAVTISPPADEQIFKLAETTQAELGKQISDIILQKSQIEESLAHYRQLYENIINTKFWKLTKPLRITLDVIKRIGK
jgi:SAM-dependent methyltransferase